MTTTLSKINYGELVLPCTYTSIESEEMMYVEGGWSMRYSNRYLHLTFTKGEAAWIIAGTATLCGIIIGIAAGSPATWAIAAKAGVIACGVINLIATVVATHDSANKKYYIKKYIGI